MRPFYEDVGLLRASGSFGIAGEKEFVGQILSSARNIECDTSAVSLALKARRIDTDDLKKKLASEDLARNRSPIRAHAHGIADRGQAPAGAAFLVDQAI
jgi:hypothetical protein